MGVRGGVGGVSESAAGPFPRLLRNVGGMSGGGGTTLDRGRISGGVSDTGGSNGGRGGGGVVDKSDVLSFGCRTAGSYKGASKPLSPTSANVKGASKEMGRKAASPVSTHLTPMANDGMKPIDGSATSLGCLLYTSPSPRDLSTSRMPSSA